MAGYSCDNCGAHVAHGQRLCPRCGHETHRLPRVLVYGFCGLALLLVGAGGLALTVTRSADCRIGAVHTEAGLFLDDGVLRRGTAVRIRVERMGEGRVATVKATLLGRDGARHQTARVAFDVWQSEDVEMRFYAPVQSTSDRVEVTCH